MLIFQCWVTSSPATRTSRDWRRRGAASQRASQPATPLTISVSRTKQTSLSDTPSVTPGKRQVSAAVTDWWTDCHATCIYIYTERELLVSLKLETEWSRLCINNRKQPLHQDRWSMMEIFLLLTDGDVTGRGCSTTDRICVGEHTVQSRHLRKGSWAVTVYSSNFFSYRRIPVLTGLRGEGESGSPLQRPRLWEHSGGGHFPEKLLLQALRSQTWHSQHNCVTSDITGVITRTTITAVLTANLSHSSYYLS